MQAEVAGVREGEVGGGRQNRSRRLETEDWGSFFGGVFKFFCVSLEVFWRKEARNEKSTKDRTWSAIKML